MIILLQNRGMTIQVWIFCMDLILFFNLLLACTAFATVSRNTICVVLRVCVDQQVILPMERLGNIFCARCHRCQRSILVREVVEEVAFFEKVISRKKPFSNQTDSVQVSRDAGRQMDQLWPPHNQRYQSCYR